MALSKKDSENLGFLAAGSRQMAQTLERMEVEQQTQTDLLDAILSATRSGGKGGGGVSGFFESIGKAGKGIREAGGGMKDFAEGVLALSKALLRFVVVPKKSAFTGFFKDLSEAFGKAGKEADDIRKGMALTKNMGTTLLLFGGSLALSTILFIVGAPGAVLATLAIAGLSYVFAQVGKHSDTIGDGARAVAWMALSITALGLGVMIFFKALGDDPLTALVNTGIMTLTIGLLAAVFYIAGKGAKEIAIGSAALIVGGIALIAISAGLVVFKKAEFGFYDLGVLAATIVTLGVVFALAGIPIVAGLIALGAGALILAGVSLITISLGLLTFSSVKWTEEDGESLVDAMTSLGEGFSALSLKAMLKMAVGVPALIGAGIGLMSISAGLKAFQKVQFTEDDSEKLKVAITGLSEAFAVAGGAKPASGSSLFQKVFFGEPNIVEKGITSVMGAGKALKSVVEGLTAWTSLEKLGLGKDAFDADKEGSMMWNIKATIGAIHEVFAAIGRGGGEDDRSLFGQLFRAKRTDTEKGINAVKDVGGVLIGIADGLKKWMDLDKAGIDIPKISENVKLVLTAISQAFSQIGGMETEDSAFFGLISWDENTVEKGIDAVKGVGDELEGIANGLKIFSDLKNVGMKPEDFDPNVKDSLMWNIAQTVTGVAKVFSNIASGEFVSEGWIWDDNLVEEGLSAVKGIGPELESLAKSMKAFSEMKDDTPSKVSAAIQSIFSVVSKAPAEGKIDALEETADELERIAEFEDPFESIAKSFGKIVESTEKFASAFKKMDKTAIISYTAFTKALVDFSNIKASNLLSTSSVAADFISKSTNKITAPPTTTTTEPTPAPKLPTQTGEKSVPTGAPTTASKTKAPVQDNAALTQAMSDLAGEMKSANSKLSAIRDKLEGVVKVEQT